MSDVDLRADVARIDERTKNTERRVSRVEMAFIVAGSTAIILLIRTMLRTSGFEL